jgi:3-hydroxyisobutyrate dehydrogenase-like beta-hydroxyacid dehydrogenase
MRLSFTTAGEAANALLAAGAAWLRGDFEPRFSLALARKDLGLAQELARATDTPMRLGALCEKEMIEAMARGWADRVFWGTDITRMPLFLAAMRETVFTEN